MSQAVTRRVPSTGTGDEVDDPYVDSIDELSPQAKECRLLHQHPWPRSTVRSHRRFIRFEVTEQRKGRVIAGVVYRTCTGGCGRIRSEPVRLNRAGKMVRDGGYGYGQEPGTKFLLRRRRLTDPQRSADLEEVKDQVLRRMFPDLNW